MVGRREFGVIGLSAVAATALQGSLFAAQKPGQAAVEHKEHDDMMQKCAKACSDCQRACDMCSTHCAHKLHSGEKDHMASMATCLDCADMCAVASQVAARGGPFAATICGACAEVCAMCAKECEKFPDDEHMKMCAAECRKCEKACREMTGHDKH